MAVKAIQEQLERERGRADASDIRVRELTAELETARARMTELREARAAAEAKTEVAESRVDDLMMQAGKLAQAQARADLLQVEVDRSRAEADRLRQEFAATGAKPARRRWLPWRRRRG